MENRINRRTFLTNMVNTGAALTLTSTLLTLASCSSEARKRPPLNLVKDPQGLCDLPEEFSYTQISTAGDVMSDGNLVPEFHDGMACFSDKDHAMILVRNHEMPLYFPFNPESPEPNYAYDKKSSGGTTTIWLNNDLTIKKHYLSLTGTIRNCGGGKTPWGTWISSEEPHDEGWFMGKRHGYNYEVDPLAPLVMSKPLKAMGRFNHEAVAFDENTGIAYQSEDKSTGCFYRFIPNERGKLAKGGVLQALKFSDPNIRHTSESPLTLNMGYPCHWVTVDEPDPEDNTVHKQAQQKGATIFVRGEGIIAHKDGIYFACTAGGADKVGQIFKYVPNNDGNTGTISVVFESKANGLLENPDNITLNNWGDLIICEDNDLDRRCLVGLTPDGNMYHIAATSRSEWAGACFSPDGKTLFANIQRNPGTTVAITGPWQKLRNSAAPVK